MRALIDAGDGETLIAMVRRIEAGGEVRVAVSIDPPMMEVEELTFDQAVEPMRFRRA